MASTQMEIVRGYLGTYVCDGEDQKKMEERYEVVGSRYSSR